MACEECTCFGKVTEEQRNKVREIIQHYRGKSGVLIQVLHEAQQVVGYLPREIQAMVAEGLDVPLSEVYSVVTFYALFSLKPKGRHQISVCKGTACYVRGAEDILNRLEQDLGIRAKDTTSDGKFSMEVVRCMGACGLGPVVRVDDDIYARLKPDRLKEILAKYE
ncbi:MAG: NADH-quinone oxidoreductase subunit NuoE [Clostridia bacterium]